LCHFFACDRSTRTSRNFRGAFVSDGQTGRAPCH
jgi:hypothetical protein